MSTSLINSITTPDSTAPPDVAGDLTKTVAQLVQYDVQIFANNTARALAYTNLGTSPPVGAVSYRIDGQVYERYNGAGSPTLSTSWTMIAPYRSKQVLSGTAASVSFSSIPTTGSVLRLIIQGAGDTAAAYIATRIRFNGDSSAIYDTQVLTSNAAITASSEALNQTGIDIGEVAAATAPAGASGSHQVYIPNYAATTFWKALVSTHVLRTGTGTTTAHTKQYGGSWRSTAAITSITIFPTTGNFIAGSTFALEAWD